MATNTQQYYEYITKDADRWDLISYNFYADPTLYEQIITANSDVPITPILSSGLKLKIPVMDDSQTIQFTLPPWKS